MQEIVLNTNSTSTVEILNQAIPLCILDLHLVSLQETT